MPDLEVAPVPLGTLKREISAGARGQAGIVAEWLLLGVLVWFVVDWSLAIGAWLHHVDFALYYSGAWQLAHGVNIYGGPPGLIPYGGQFEIDAAEGQYNYPPWMALIMVPLTYLGYPLASRVWLVLSLVFAGACLFMSARLCQSRVGIRRMMILSAALFLWRPVVDLLLYGQATLLIGAAALAAVLLLRSNRPLWAGVPAMVAFAKPQVVALLLVGLMLWEWRHRRSLAFAASCCGAAIVACVISFVMAPGWPYGLLHFHPIVHDYWGYYVTTRILLTYPFGQNWISDGIYLAILVAGTGAVLWSWWQSNASPVYLAAVTLSATPLLTPLINTYDYVLLILPLFVLGITFWRTRQSSAYPLILGLGLTAWVTTGADKWMFRWLERESVWNFAQSLIGMEGTNRLHTHLKWDTRFLAMLLPLILLIAFKYFRGSVEDALKAE